MLKVRKTDDGVWVGNGQYRVFVSENKLDTLDHLPVIHENAWEGEVVYNHITPMELNKTYDHGLIVPQPNMVVIGSGSHCAYQYREFFVDMDDVRWANVWVSSRSGEAMRTLPYGSFTIIYLGETNA